MSKPTFELLASTVFVDADATTAAGFGEDPPHAGPRRAATTRKRVTGSSLRIGRVSLLG
jgi:hypothetical protein